MNIQYKNKDDIKVINNDGTETPYIVYKQINDNIVKCYDTADANDVIDHDFYGYGIGFIDIEIKRITEHVKFIMFMECGGKKEKAWWGDEVIFDLTDNNETDILGSVVGACI